MAKPPIVCLCGSTRFIDAFHQANYRLTMQGHIVLSVGFSPNAAPGMHGGEVDCTPAEKIALDELHLRKIDLADYVFVLNVGGYVGESTSNEIVYDKEQGKPVYFLEGRGSNEDEEDANG